MKIIAIFATASGEMLEWLKRHAWKACIRQNRISGSNPDLSAINAENQQIAKQTPNFTPKNVKLGVFVLFKKNRRAIQNRSAVFYHFQLSYQYYTSI